MKRVMLIAVLLIWPMVASADAFSDAAGRYRVLPSSRIHFSVAQMGGAAVAGEFKRFKGSFQLDGRDVSRSKVDFTLEPASVSAVDPRVEEFIRSEPVFNAAKYPVVTFRSTSVKRTGDNTASIDGRLTAKGVTRPTRFSVAFGGRSGGTLKFHVTGKMSRALFGMDVGAPVYSNVVVLDMMLVGARQ
ncbi:polyisoprenoid-binding protein [Rhizobium sp. KVB221]|uniref:Polyisoprenoid-binding protein n=1 Tax=Rhizobium setariae TaxID=2801340 RepID=A0A936YRS9_9HYPH|nr:YceI family protein [Rhizobium setariae]MBL0371397.1 polyisoprenoid-binding protein [Rhizobium setariae]